MYMHTETLAFQCTESCPRLLTTGERHKVEYEIADKAFAEEVAPGKWNSVRPADRHVS